MAKRLPGVARDEIAVRLDIEIASEAFRQPVITKAVQIVDWREGIDLEDVEFRGSFITPEEAETIRQRRLAKMREILEGQGYKIVGPEDEAADGERDTDG